LQNILERNFLLVYESGGGITLGDIARMPVWDVQWYYNRLAEQKKKEADEERKAADRIKGKSA